MRRKVDLGPIDNQTVQLCQLHGGGDGSSRLIVFARKLAVLLEHFSDGVDATNNLFSIVERYHDDCPPVIKPSTGASNAKELWSNKTESGYAVGTAGTKAVGRSQTIQLFHGSEVAFWPNAATHFAGVVQAVPDLPGQKSSWNPRRTV